MKSIVILFPAFIDSAHLERKIGFIKTQFSENHRLIFMIPSGFDSSLFSILSEKYYSINSDLDFDKFSEDILIFYRSEINDEFNPIYNKISSFKGVHEAYTIDKHGRLLPVASELSAKELKHINTHIFNRLGPKGLEGEFYYFPYAYLFKYPGLGPINPLGFRVSDDYQNLKNRSSTHRVIAFFGGSAMWSMYSYPNEMFPALLEALLNQYCKDEKLDLSFSVLNFGMHGHVVLNEIIAYLLYCQNLNVDYVVAHDGWNDLLYGMLSDKYLLIDHSIVYQYNLEEWSKILHNTQSEKSTQPDLTSLNFNNLPHNIISAYLDRKKQFQNLVLSSGSEFIWSLQPSIYSKSNLTLAEDSYLKSELREVNPFSKVYKKMPFLYEKLVQNSTSNISNHFLNFDDLFSRCDQDVDLFGDVIHTTPEGDSMIAMQYFDYFKNHILKSFSIKEAGVCV